MLNQTRITTPLQFAQGLLFSLVVLLPLSAMAQTDKTFTNSIGVEFVLIPAGDFMTEEWVSEYKNPFGETERETFPGHKVTISKPFYLGKYEVTQEQWYAVMGDNPAHFKGRKNPVEQVSWKNVKTFIRRLNAKEGTNKYRLPTEAEWEYAARAGTTSEYSFGNNASQLGKYAWYDGNSGFSTHPVGQKQPNPWGLYDMHGNVLEWVQDWFGADWWFSESAITDPHGPSSGDYRVVRGGSWFISANYLRSAYRGGSTPDNRSDNFGFRLARSPGQ
jgi:formylglycine-generating enzyme required for sulfatase activity